MACQTTRFWKDINGEQNSRRGNRNRPAKRASIFRPAEKIHLRAPASMRTLTLVCLLAAVTLCLCHGDDWAHSNDSPSSEDARHVSKRMGSRSQAFISRRDSAAIMRRQPGSPQGAAVVAAPDVASPLESHREICELSVACDELADQIGFEEAYRRFYGPV